MATLVDRYRADTRTAAVRAALIEHRELTIGACQGSLPLVLLVAAAAGDTRWPRILICGDASAVRDDLEALGQSAAVLTEIDRFDASDGDSASDIDRTAQQMRIAAVEAWATGAWLVATPRAAQQPVPDLAEVAKSSLVIKPGETHDMQALVERLVDVGYRVVATVEARGQVAVRGGVVDVYPFVGADPLRLEFFGDQVEAVRRFDAFTQETVSKVEAAVLATASGSLASASLWQQLPAGPLAVLGDLPLRGRLDRDHGRHEVRFARQLEEGAHDGASTSVERLRGDLLRGFSELKQLAREAGEAAVLLLARNDEAAGELRAHLRDAGCVGEVHIGRLSTGWRDLECGLIVAHDFELAAREAVRRRGTRVAGGQPLGALTDLKRGDLVVHMRHGIGLFRGIATLEKRGYLEDYLELEFAEQVKVFVPVDAIDLVQKYVGASGSRPDLSKIGGTAWSKRRARAEKAIEDLSGELLEAQAKRLAAGGLAMTADGARSRQFEAAFPYEETEDQLAAAREIKADQERPIAMDRLLCGDVGFGKTEVAMRAVFKAVAGGFQAAVLAPTTLLAEQHVESFTERFAGQGIEIAGLTRFTTTSERAAVLARAAKGEVQVLIGTHALLSDALAFARLGLLVIDEEHRFGVKQKEKLRRMRSPEAGQPPDVLALSATPIPRTLHFSLLGLRDISVLAEAPAERLAVETRVSPWDDALIRNAVARERERNGQIFFVHNHVRDIDAIVFKLGRICPDLKLDVVHGQMPEARIARAMEAYKKGELHCLVSTSIIESGIDIPNANTLFVNNAHCFGLAELHQIRGRIGRRREQAHAYFLVPGNRELTDEARARLDAIQEYAELGAGFKLAMRDLELRGAGNLLGGEQSGHIDAIGYELYTRLVGEAVARLKVAGAEERKSSGAEVRKPAIDPRSLIGLAVDAYIPDTWLETPQLKFELHKQLDGCRRASDLAAIAASARDRYGPPPPPVQRLFAVRALRLRCLDLGIGRVEVADRQLRLHLDGALPAEVAKANLPEIVHLQLNGKIVVLFLRAVPDQDAALRLVARLLGVELSVYGVSTH